MTRTQAKTPIAGARASVGSGPFDGQSRYRYFEGVPSSEEDCGTHPCS